MNMNDNLDYNYSQLDTLVFYKPGDLVILNKEELNPPVMLVKEKVTRQFKSETGSISNIFRGMKCIWFDKNNVLQEAIFSTKDLKFYNKE